VATLAAVALLGGGIVLVVAGAEAFFDGLLAVAARIRIPAFTLTALVSGLELENLAAGIAADLKGLPDAAAGTFLGGTSFLVLGVAGLAAAAAPFRAPLPWPVYAWTAAAPLPLLAFGLDGDVSRLEGGLLVAWFCVATAGLVLSGRGLLGAEAPRRRRFALARLLAGLGILTAGGEVLGEGIQRAVARFGISQALLGNTVVAAAVEAEEVGRVAVPARHRRGDVAAANLFGTAVHFLALNAGVIALVRPLDVGHQTVVLHLPVAVAGTVLLTALLAARRGLGRAEGVALVALYGGYLAGAVILAGRR
jgi:cation:H+ antiporter